MKIWQLVLIVSIGCLQRFDAFAQQTMTPAGGQIKSSGGAVSFTVGQVAYVLKNDDGSNLNEGVQQVYTKGTGSYLNEGVQQVYTKGTGSYLNEGLQQVYTRKTKPVKELVYLKDVLIYPNPTQETAIVVLSTWQDVQIRYTIMDFLGREISNGSILSDKTELPLSDLPSGSYFIRLMSKSEKRVFLIVKI